MTRSLQVPGACARSGRGRVVLLLLFATAAPFVTRHASAREHLRIRADAEIVNVGLVRTLDSAEVTGGLRDDVGHPIARAEVRLPLPAGGGDPSACREGVAVGITDGMAVLHTDDVGFFCVRLPANFPAEGVEFRYDGDRYHGSARATVPHETGQRAMHLGFESPDLTASLDAPSFVVWVTTQVVEGTGSGDPVRLVLFHQPSLERADEIELGATDVQIGTTAKFDVDTHALGAPGEGKLIVRFAGTGLFSPASEAVPLNRRAMTELSLARDVPPSDPSDGVELALGVGSKIGAVTGGWVEALVAGQSVGLAPVKAGAARVLATFTPARGKPATVSLRFVTNGTGWVTGAPLTVAVPLRPASPWRGTPWLIAAAAVGYWVVRSWRRPGRALRPEKQSREISAKGRASIEVLETHATETGWRGRVVDAHDGTGIAGARVSIVVPAFDGEGVAAAQTTAEDGSFSLPHVAAARNDGSRLIVTSPHHATLSNPAPADGVLAICLVSRRRALLDRLVGWTGRAGVGWSRRREPTPLEVADLARHRQDVAVLGWAAAVGEAAYGPVPPDELRERELIEREPPIPGGEGDR